ncbi:MAG: hypothetical protein QOJ99_5066 [Bryobacterales bacterium]|nr:hypothetical protein [Bryobacterales bacterium]
MAISFGGSAGIRLSGESADIDVDESRPLRPLYYRASKVRGGLVAGRSYFDIELKPQIVPGGGLLLNGFVIATATLLNAESHSFRG